MAAMNAGRQPIVRGTGFALRDAWPWPVFSRLARLGDELGYRAMFLPEIAGRDAFAALMGAAGETSRTLLGTGIVPMVSRRPELTAMGVATVHERSGGRAILGLGTGPPRPGALDELRAQVGRIRGALGAATGRDAGRSVLVLDRPAPIWIAALGPRAVALAGLVADGVLLNWCTPERVAEARAAVREAAGRAGRDPDSVTIAVYIRSAIGEDDAARRALGAAAAEYASYPAYRRQFEAMGIGKAAAAAAGDEPPIDVVAPLLDAVCLSGSRERARFRLQEYRDAGCDLPVVYPVAVPPDHERSVADTVRMLAPP
jgi:alkanesulfonate monooxygenase SsuD/methylene tetrahydromethanopterin reductase-like flavin-dependent oxidoreductase (luciferase family)